MPSLTAADLFTPAPSGVGPFGAVPAGTAPPGSWLADMLELAALVQLPTTAWQAGGPERTILAIESVQFQSSDVNISTIAQGGTLQTAAFGTVTSTALDGTTVVSPVTPDPSNAAQNPTGALGWLDLLSVNVYGVQRLTAAAASGPLAFVNLKGSTVGPYAAGAYHAGNASSGATYANLAPLTIPSSAIGGTGGQVSGVVVGFLTTTISTTSAHGLVPGQTVYVQLAPTTGVVIFPGTLTPGSGFAIVVSCPTTTSFTIGVASSGMWTAGGTVYLATVATMQADVAGIGSNAAPGTVTTAVTQNVGVFVSNVVAWSGSNWESNGALATRCTLSLAAKSPNGPSQAYVYFAETAAQIFAQQVAPWNSPPYTLVPPYTLTNGPVSASETANPQTGIVTTVVASATPASTTLGAAVTPGCAQLAISGITNANPCVIATGGNHGLSTGMSASLSFPPGSGAAALLAALTGPFVVTVIDATHFSVPVDATALGAWVAGGSVEGGDLGAIDALLQTNVVPDGTTAVTVSALALPITVTATVVVPQAYVAAYQAAVAGQVGAQLGAYPVGGNAASSPPNSVTWDDMLAALEEAGVLVLGQPSFVVAVQSLVVSDGPTTITASGQGIAFPSPQYQAILAGAFVTVLGT